MEFVWIVVKWPLRSRRSKHRGRFSWQNTASEADEKCHYEDNKTGHIKLKTIELIELKI